MQRKIVLKIIISSLFLLTFASNSLINAQEGPPGGLPHVFYGYAIDEEGFLIPNGNVTVVLNDAEFKTPIKNGSFGFQQITEAFHITGDSSDAGDTIYFYINDTLTSQTASFQAGGINDDYSRYMNLSFDEIPPVISQVSITLITSSQATISWITNENSNSIVNYGTSKQLINTKQDFFYTKSHNLILSNLNSDTIYYFEIISYDISGNIATDDNSSNYYSFETDLSEQNGGNNGQNGGSVPGGNGFIPAPTPPNEANENIPPIANAGGPYFGKINQPVSFDGSASKDSDGYIIEYIWDFGDGTVIKTNDITIEHTYLSFGEYPVILKVIDNNGTNASSETQVNISSDDSDNDGWSDDAENFYGTNSTDSSDYPKDSDGDKVPDDSDLDDDNDGLTDLKEEEIGTNATNKNDVLRILNEYGLFYLLDLNNDGDYDKYYNITSNVITYVKTQDNYLLLDIDDDGNYEYKYDKTSGKINKYDYKLNDLKIDYSLLIIFFGIIILILLIYGGRKYLKR